MPNDVWIKNWPTNTESPSSSCEELTGNWNCLETWWNQQHYTLTSGTSAGDHRDYRVSAVMTGTSAVIAALPSPGSGAIAYDYENGRLAMYGASGWRGITRDYWSRSRTIMVSSSITSATWTRLVGGDEEEDQFDSLSEVATGTARATMLGTGRYLVIGSCRWPLTSLNYLKAVALYVNGVQVAICQRYGSGVRSMEVQNVCSLAAGDYIEVWAYHSASGSPVTTVGGSLQFNRIS